MMGKATWRARTRRVSGWNARLRPRTASAGAQMLASAPPQGPGRRAGLNGWFGACAAASISYPAARLATRLPPRSSPRACTRPAGGCLDGVGRRNTVVLVLESWFWRQQGWRHNLPSRAAVGQTLRFRVGRPSVSPPGLGGSVGEPARATSTIIVFRLAVPSRQPLRGGFAGLDRPSRRGLCPAVTPTGPLGSCRALPPKASSAVMAVRPASR